MDVPVELSKVVISELGQEQIIYLKEVGGERTFPIMIGTNEAIAIDRRIKGIETPRPMTHELLGNVIAQLGASVDRIVIDDLRGYAGGQFATFIATIYLDTAKGEVPVDSRPSDAISLSAGLGTPLYVTSEVFNAVLTPPQSKSERIELLRQRMQMLEERIAEFETLVNDENFVDNVPNDVVAQHVHELQEMQAEYDAIDRVLKKLG